MAFDVGKILANLLLMFFACDGHATGACGVGRRGGGPAERRCGLAGRLAGRRLGMCGVPGSGVSAGAGAAEWVGCGRPGKGPSLV